MRQRAVRPTPAVDRSASNPAVATTLVLPPHWIRERYGSAGTKRQILSTWWQALADHNTRRRWSVSHFVAWYTPVPREVGTSVLR
jgi:hypothetical protein